MILVVDDDSSVTASLSLLLKQAGYRTATAASPQEALESLARGPCELVLQDMNFSRRTSGEEGMELLREIRRRHADLPVILITAWGSIELAVQGIKAGAADFVTKPWTNSQILQAVKTALGLAAATPVGKAEVTREELDSQGDFSNVIGSDPELLMLLEAVRRVAPTEASVLITGESGTGKDEIAQAIFRNSRRRDRPFVKVNLGGISSTLFDSEMFGHVKGAFTDARQDRAGRFALADGGTIFLDEIGDLTPGGQVKLLRVLQDRTYEALGSSRTRSVDVRVISATNRNLLELVESGDFREDLLYRLNLIVLHLPPLRRRPGDVPLLARRFAQGAAHVYRRELEIDGEALGWLQDLPWPGNIRQLKQLVERDRPDELRHRPRNRRFRSRPGDAARGRSGRGQPAGPGHHDSRRVGAVDDPPLHGALQGEHQPGGPGPGTEPGGALPPLREARAQPLEPALQAHKSRSNLILTGD